MDLGDNDTPIKVIAAPCHYRAPPKLRSLTPLPLEVRKTLEPLWNDGIVRPDPLRLYRLRQVLVAEEGLVFEPDGRLLAQTCANHPDEMVERARIAVLASKVGGHPRIPRAILASGRGCENYGHFIYEVLPRAWLARTQFSGWPAIVLTSRPRLDRVVRQALGRAGFGPDDVLPVTREPIFVDELIHVEGLTRHARYLSSLLMPCLDEIASGIAAGPARKIYAARHPAYWRDFEDVARTEGLLVKLGFTKIVAADLTFDEQVGAFKGATEVVGVAGAALTNTVFCRPGTRVVTFMPGSAQEVLFWMIAEARRLYYEEVRCPEVGPTKPGGFRWDRAIRVSKRDLHDVLSRK